MEGEREINYTDVFQISFPFSILNLNGGRITEKNAL